MSDYIVRATAGKAQIRAFAITSKELVEKARTIHNSSPVMTAALGRLLSAGAMMGAMLKGDADLLTLQIKGDGPAKGLTVTADAHGNVKGYAVEPQVILPPNAVGKLDVGGALGHGFFNVIKDLGLKEPYVGQTELQTGEIAEDLTYYFATSEQVPSSVGLGVLMNKNNTVRQAGGFVIQLLPFAEEEIIEKLEENLKNISSVTSMLETGNTPEQILGILLEGLDMEIMDKTSCQYHCNCSRERTARAVISLGKKEISQMIEDGKTIEVNCQFCGSHYYFSIDDLQEMLKVSKERP